MLQKIGYESDLNLWLEETIAQLKRGDLQSVDIEHLVEELEGLAGRDKRELKSRLIVLLSHILKRIHLNNAYDNRGWELTIIEQRSELTLLLEQSPSLRQYLLEIFDDAYGRAIESLRKSYPEASFPDTWQYARGIEMILGMDWWQ